MKHRAYTHLTRDMQRAVIENVGELTLAESVRLLPRRRFPDHAIAWTEGANVPSRDEWLSLNVSISNLRQRAQRSGRNSRFNRLDASTIERLRHQMEQLPDPRRMVGQLDREQRYTRDIFTASDTARIKADLDARYGNPKPSAEMAPKPRPARPRKERPSGTYPVAVAKKAA